MGLRIIFLDIDGVLNTLRTRQRSNRGMIGIDPKRVALLREMIDATGAVIVLTSTWRNEWDPDYEKCGPDGKYLADSLTAGGVTVYDKIPGLSGIHRGGEIRRYAKEHACRSFIVLDDEQFPDYTINGIRESGPRANWIHTQFYTGRGGLRRKHIDMALKYFERIEKNQAEEGLV